MRRTFLLSAVGLAVAGCNPGENPAPMTKDAAIAATSKMSYEDQVKGIESSPMSPESKQQEIAKLKAKFGKQ